MELTLQDVTFAYGGGRPLFSDVNLTVDAGMGVGIFGPSGQGKSTLCAIMAGVIPRNIKGNLSGEVRYDGRLLEELALAEIASSVGIVFQSPDTQLFLPTVEDELAFGCENLLVEPDEIGRRIDAILSRFSLDPYRHTEPKQLSGGQQQLIALASVLIMRPEVLILDEVFSQLDDSMIQTVVALLREQKEAGTSLVVIDHKGVLNTFVDVTVDLTELSGNAHAADN